MTKTGTCPICSKTVSLANGVLRIHGTKSTSCEGTYKKPVEETK